MDIPRLSMNLAQSDIIRNFSIGMIRNALDQAEQVGEQLVEMIQSTQVPTEGTINILA